MLFRRKSPEWELAKAIAKRGRSARATIESIDASAQPVRMRLSFTPEGGAPVLVDVAQKMPQQTLVGLEPGQPASIMYDAEDPQKVVVMGSPHYRVMENGSVVRVVDLEQPGQ